MEKDPESVAGTDVRVVGAYIRMRGSIPLRGGVMLRH